MLKYKYVNVVFSEIPEEITLAISISGCQIHCSGCHSRELWEDAGTPLSIQELERLLEGNRGVSTLLLLGGERDIDSLTFLFQHFYGKIKTAWYSGLDLLPRDKQGILQYLDYYKQGHYDAELGGLDKPTTNQKLYTIEHTDNNKLIDITYKLQKKNGN